MSGPQLEILRGAGAIVPCGRCGCDCRVAEARRADATMLRFAAATTPGRCLECAIREWFYMMNENHWLPDFEPEELRHPWIREQFANIMRAFITDSVASEIDWPKVIENWNLPLPSAKRGKRKGSRK